MSPHTTQRESCRPITEGLTALFSRGDLPAEIVVLGRHSPLSPVRVGEHYAWREVEPGIGTYAPQDGGVVHIMAHEVRRNWMKLYGPAAKAEVAA
jgi:hypothetical protein